MPTTYVLGLGNVLMGDDGFGPAVVHAFEAEYVVGPNVAVVDLGTPGLDLTPWLADAERVILIDTVKSKLLPGALRRYRKSDVLRYAPSVRVGPHDPGVKEALLALEFAGRAPRELTLLGVVPGRTEMALQLTPALQAAVPRAVNAIVAILIRHGERIARRTSSASAWSFPSAVAGFTVSH
jgi:hydrogenase maturation protease